MRYLPKSEIERREMLSVCGVSSIEELFDSLPPEVRLSRPLKLDPGKSEYEIVDYFRERAAENANGYASFLGAGVYSHYRPVLVDTVVSRGEFLTSYTPYQAEISQGTLTAIFEFQTMVCQLTGMEVANASMYDGSTAVPEAAMMAARITGKDRILAARSVHPEYREVLHTYAKHQGLPVVEFAYDAESGEVDSSALEAGLDENTAAVIVQTPNFFGVLENVDRLAGIAHRRGALLVVVFTEAVSLGLLKPPGAADIVAGELQSFAISPGYGGPYAGVIATKEQYMRQLPGRLVGETLDSHGNRAYCLTLSTREQHIRREKATSNICTNQALIALMATVFMTVYGKRGLRELAEQNLAKAHYLASGLNTRFSGRFFNEFVVKTNGRSPEEINQRLLDHRILGGLPLGRFYPELNDTLLLCATEMSRRESMDRVKEVLI
ncbi:MAG: aminomethyl-transferring glycine dehydrogenase subunit GcvPA [Bryobacteraceae bacterium]|nr:aminomethyl-transferring glycine dehydrogenase subunit GcvPA [Bryobacterales bacterium]MEB2361478.1 aminomethyl-transferring glycine dehydrogenase subunit GcvPA [Bryobacterales bacterium]NUN01578.1 aminomethyl-transferring glycine dehydrogenase subunit GcvPA [Bryobacteraceae bacterium]